ncbi:RNA polymerase sigma factor [Pseudoalteromonas denitrificans]|uniref:RNA polymerase sigma-70 factor, ECF subfamily n=1 Tax=Pseudoalteromonas denitrificans DSM 6059 TaxID=1123010 RepID=A0A1I1PER6_9GAMM|nr:RNA polymerase sigma factor [Pseudoalteromonas denitrificans]SFD08166.1 RNA polymerase sigma-70 factor, ECF subfamily [Pseudoalteromonas denitrificans DSM 6059]
MLIKAEQRFAAIKEEQLISLVQQGDRAAFEQLYTQYINRVYGLCLRLTADKSIAEDASQEVFVQLWQKISNFDGKAKFSTWLHSVTANITISYLRKQKSWLQKVVSIETQGMDEHAIEAEHDLNGLDKLILRLPERARMVFVLYAVEGYRHEEIATILNMAVGSSKAQYHRARNLLKEWYENE